MSSTGGGIVVRYNSLKISGSVEDLTALAENTNDEALKASVLSAISPPTNDLTNGEVED